MVDDNRSNDLACYNQQKKTTHSFNQGNSQLSVWSARLQNTYEQLYAAIKSQQRWASKETGSASEGKLDNTAISTLISIERSAHTLYFGYQRMIGDSPWQRVNGTSGATLANDSSPGALTILMNDHGSYGTTTAFLRRAFQGLVFLLDVL